MEDRKQIIKNLIKREFSYQKIGKFLGISKQRVHQILNNNRRQRRFKLLPNLNRFQNSYLYKVLKEKYSPTEIWHLWKKNPQLKRLNGTDFLSEIVRIRDDKTCQICGKIWEKGRKFDIHHIKKEDENNHTYANYKKFDEMITLCHKCHLNLKHIREKMHKNRKKKIRAHKILRHTKKKNNEIIISDQYDDTYRSVP